MMGVLGMPLASADPTDADYRKTVNDHPDTPQVHFDIATWCGDNGMATARLNHLRRAIALDPDFAPARHALGQVRVGQIWLKTRNDSPAASPNTAPPNNPAADLNQPLQNPEDPKPDVPPPDKDPEKWIREAMAKWRVTLHSIRRAYLMSGAKVAPPNSFNIGSERILAIKDPLAIEAIATVLAAGPIDLRRLMVGALKQFPSDEATLNLIVTALLDPAPIVRRDAARALAARRDDQLTDGFRRALLSHEEAILTGAAEAIAEFKLQDAVPDLVNLLKGDRRVKPRVTRQALFDAFQTAYGQPVTVKAGGRTGTHHPKIAVVARDTAIQPRYPGQPIVQRRPEFRTTIQEALIELTGQNFGFDAKAWMQWYNRQKADEQTPDPKNE
jgi:hypothetical protein